MTPLNQVFKDKGMWGILRKVRKPEAAWSEE